MPFDAQTRGPPKLKLELHCDIVIIWPAIPSALHLRLINRALTTRTAKLEKPNLTTAHHGALGVLLTGAGEMGAELATAEETHAL